MYENHLSHHGIKGMEWGIRRGPPYPLDAGQRTNNNREPASKVKKIKISNGFDDLSEKYQNKYMNKLDLKKLDFYSEEFKSLYPGENFIADLRKNTSKLSRLVEDIDEENNLPLKNRKTSIEDDLKKVNPGYNKTSRSSNYTNCAMCAMAYELRRRGYDVMAKQNSSPKDRLFFATFWPNMVKPKSNNGGFYTCDSKKEFLSDIKDLMTTSKNGDRGMVRMVWPDGSGHICNYEIVNNDFIICDGQSGRSYKPENIDRFNTINIYPDTQLWSMDYNAIRFALE